MRKGITPILSVVLLLMMTIAVFGITYTWITDSSGDIQSSAEENIAGTKVKMSAQVNIVSVYRDSTSGNLALTLRNTGSYAYSNSGSSNNPYNIVVTLDDQPASISSTKDYSTGSSVTGDFKKGDTINIVTATAFPTNSGVHKIKVNMPNGISDEYTCSVIGSSGICD